MRSITIHGLDDLLDSLIREKAQRQGSSLNKMIKQILSDSLGVSGGYDRKTKFVEFSGVWSKKDAKTFHKQTKDLERVDAKDWL